MNKWENSLFKDNKFDCGNLIKYATSKNATAKKTMFQHRNIHRYACTAAAG